MAGEDVVDAGGVGDPGCGGRGYETEHGLEAGTVVNTPSDPSSPGRTARWSARRWRRSPSPSPGGLCGPATPSSTTASAPGCRRRVRPDAGSWEASAPRRALPRQALPWCSRSAATGALPRPRWSCSAGAGGLRAASACTARTAPRLAGGCYAWFVPWLAARYSLGVMPKVVRKARVKSDGRGYPQRIPMAPTGTLRMPGSASSRRQRARRCCLRSVNGHVIPRVRRHVIPQVLALSLST